MFDFASKMLNTIMGTEEQQAQQAAHGMPQQQQSVRPMGGFPQVRPTPQGPGGAPRPYGGPPQFSGPRPSPGVIRAGPPNFGGPPRPMGGPGAPHRFNGPQPAHLPRGMQPGPPQQGMRPPGPGMPQGPGPGQNMQGNVPGGAPQMGPHMGQQMGPPLSSAPSPSMSPAMGMRPPRAPLHGQQFPGQPRPPSAGGNSVVGAVTSGAPVPDVDLSHLSAEERAMIENVMAKAQQLEQEAPPAPIPPNPALSQPGTPRMMRPEDQRPGVDYSGRLCPICRQRDVSGRDGLPGQECMECRTMVCNRCGGMTPHPETKRPEWTCGNCIKQRRMGPVPMGNASGPAGHQNLGPRPVGPYSQQQQQNPSMEWDAGRRGSGSGGPQQQQPQHPPQQQQQQGMQGSLSPQLQRWENEREFESETVESSDSDLLGKWERENSQSRRLSSEIRMFSPERTEQSEELYQSPVRSPVELDIESYDSPETYEPYDLQFPSDLYSDHSLSMCTPLSASTSQAKPSFVKPYSLSSSSDTNPVAEDQRCDPMKNGFGSHSPPVEREPADVSLSFEAFARAKTEVAPPAQPPSDDKTNALMEELLKLQSTVESYSLKRRQRQSQESEEAGEVGGRSAALRSRSPSPSPSPRDSPGKSGDSLSPLPSLLVSYLGGGSPPKDSPESPEDSDLPGPRKAIVLKEHDLDDYKSSTDEESESDSEEERQGMVGEVVTYYDHSPGEVYTIPEEEDEGGSPTGGDLVTSLNRPGIQGSLGENGSPRRRMTGQEMLPPGMSVSPDQRHPVRPQLRPQRSLDNRLPLVTTQGGMELSSGVDAQGNPVSFANNMNTQVANPIDAMDNQSMLGHSTLNASMSVPMSTQSSSMMAVPSSTSIINSQQQQQPLNSLQQQPQPQNMFALPTTAVQEQQVDLSNGALQQRTIQQQQAQLGQSGIDNTVGSEWSSSINMSGHSIMGPTSVASASSTDQSSATQTQPYQQQSNGFSQQLPPTQQQIQNQLQQQISHLQPQQQQQLQNQIQQQQQLQQNQQQLQNQQHQLQTHQQQDHQLQTQQIQTSQQQLQTSQQQLQTINQQKQLQSQIAQQQLNQQLGTSNTLSSQQQQWQQQQTQQHQHSPQQSLYDQSGRLIPTSISQFPQTQQQQGNQVSFQNQQQLNLQAQQQSQHTQQYQQLQQHQQQINLVQQQGAQHQLTHQTQGPQPQQQHLQGIGLTSHGQQSGHLAVGAQAGPGAKSISGLLADFSRALGLGSSPRPSPSEEKTEAFPIPSSGSAGLTSQGHSISPYDQYQQQSHIHQIGHQGLHSQQSPNVQQSAFAPIQDPNLTFLQQQQRQQALGQSYIQQSSQQSLQSQLGMQGLQYGGGGLQLSQAPSLVSQSQQYAHAVSQQQANQQLLSQGGVLTQQQAASLGVGVVGALSPAQAHMYQQQMALQHQAQHMKKTSRRAHLSSGGGDVRRDGASTVLIGGQGLAVTPSGMAIGALTPAVVTSLGTFIGGGQALIGTSLLQQPLSGTYGASKGFGVGCTPVGTPRSGRDPGGDSSDTMSETDSQKSLRMRRKLPCLPPDQEAAPLPSTKKRDRQRAQETFRSLSPMRMSSFDSTIPGRSYPLSSLSLSRPSASESNLRKISGMGLSDPIPRPGSALGLLQASSVVSSIGGKPDVVYPLSGNLFSTSSTFPGMGLRTTTSGFSATSDLTTTTSVLSGLYPSYKTSDSWNSNLAELAACLPPDLRHLLNKGSGPDHDLSGLSGLTSSLGETSLNVGSHLPSYMRTLREQLQEERRQLLSEERRRLEALRERDRELGARLDAVTSRAGSDGVRSRTDLSRNVGISRSAGASPLLNRKLKGHRRQLSDPKLSLPFSPIQEDGDSELQDFDRVTAGLLRPPYKSYEYESLEDSALLRPAPHLGDWDHSQSYLASSWAAAGGVLRETAINSMGGLNEEDDIRSRVASRFLSRRNSDGEAWPPASVTRSPSSRDKRHPVRKHRKSRSWHPSPYVSEEEEEEEEDTLSREEKKARIKAEIARRRQQIAERAGLHHELLRISRLREGPAEQERHSVLKSVDQLLRDQYGRYESSPSISYGGGRGPSSLGMYGGGSGGLARSSSHHFSLPPHHGGHHHHHHHHLQQHHSQYHPGGGGGHHLHGHGGAPHHLHHQSLRSAIISPSASEEDRSIERIASTFRSDDYTSMLYERLGEMSPLATDSESMGSELGLGNTPAAMPLLPDMPTRSRRLLEDLGSAPIGLNEGGRSGGTSGQTMKVRSNTTTKEMKIRRASWKEGKPPLMPRLPIPPSASGDAIAPNNLSRKTHSRLAMNSPTVKSPIREQQGDLRFPDDYGTIGGCTRKPVKNNKVTSHSNIGAEPSPAQTKKAQASHLQHPTKKYKFPVKRLLLTRDPKDRSAGFNGLGMKLVGGKELPDTSGRLAAYVAKITPRGLADNLGDVHEGDVVLEWNGVSLDNKTFEEVQSILGASSDEIELVLRSDYNILTGKRRQSEDECSRQHSGTCSLSDSQTLYQPQDTTDENESDKGPTTECAYSHFTNLKSETNLPTGDSRTYVVDAEGVPATNGKGENYETRTEMNRSPSTSTEATNTSVATSSIHQSAPTEDTLSPRMSFQSSTIRKLSDYQESIPLMSTLDVTKLSERKESCESKGSSLGGDLTRRKRTSNGRIQLQICHDPKANILYVTVLKARLPKQRNEDGTDHVQVDPYVVVYLLPERVLENQRRTRHVPMCSSPQWNQTMVYPAVSTADLKTKFLEVSARNYNTTGEDDLFGRVILFLSEDGILDEQPHSYSLKRDDTPSRRRSSQSYTKSIHSVSKSGALKRYSDGTSSKCSILGNEKDERRGNAGKMSLFAPGNLPNAPSLPTDCHATFCTIL